MKTYFKVYWLALLTFLLMNVTTSCSDDDDIVRNEFGSSLEIEKDFKISRFFLAKNEWTVPDSVQFIMVKLTSLTDNSTMQFKARIAHLDKNTEYAIMIPKLNKIPNSDYLMRGVNSENYAIGNQLTVTFENEMLTNVLGSSVDYARVFSKGSGIQKDPYQIYTAQQFTQFLRLLKSDPSHAKDIYFEQTNKIMHISGKNSGDDNFLYYGYQFAGNYNGNGHEITLQHMGPYYQVGIFSELMDGATIRNLSIDGTMTDAASNIGFLAGKATGKVLIENISVRGSILFKEGSTKDAQGKAYPNGERIGGLIGYVNNANLRLKDIEMAVTVQGTTDLGGVIGKMDSTVFQAQHITTMNDVVTAVQGKQGIGFLCGAMQKSSMQVSDVNYTQVGSKGLQGTNYCIGGVVGYADLIAESSLKNCEVNFIPEGHHEIGGLIGNVIMPGQKLHINDCVVNATEMKANENKEDNSSLIGGFLGTARVGQIILGGKSAVNCERIAGDKKVGGLIGALEGSLITSSTCAINVHSVTATQNMAGGICGQLKNGQITVGPDACAPFKDMVVTGAAETGGLIGYAREATIQGNLNLQDLGFPEIAKAETFTSTFEGTVVGNDVAHMIGGIVGECDFTEIKNCCFKGSVKGNESVGGITGFANTAQLHHCVNRSDQILGNSKVGGIIGDLVHFKKQTPIDFHHLLNFGKIESGKKVGGIAGYVDFTDRPKKKEEMVFDYLVNVGEVSGKEHVGGCIAYFKDNTDRTADTPADGGNHFIRNSANYGKVTGSEGGFVGGILGQSDFQTMLIHFTANHGEVVSLSDKKASVGGIVGEYGHETTTAGIYVSSNSEIKSCCNYGLIHSEGYGSNVGGLVGLKEEGHDDAQGTSWWIKESYNYGAVNRDGEKQDLGGICGFLDRNNVLYQCLNLGVIDHQKGNAMVGDTKGYSTYTACFTLKDVAFNDQGIALSESELGNSSNLEGFDFGNVWEIAPSPVDNKMRPQLQHCPFQFVTPLDFINQTK